MNEQHEDRPTAPTSDRAPVPALRREAGTRPHDPRGVGAMTAIIALAGVTIGFSLALLAVPMHRCPAGPLRVVERAPMTVRVAPWHGEDATLLGVMITTDDEPGALVRRVMARSPAQKAGLRPGDRIVAIDGEPIRSSHDLVRAIREREPGDQARLELLRGGEPVEIDAEFGSKLELKRQARL